MTEPASYSSVAHHSTKVFVSSTSKYLTDQRAAARNAIVGMQWHPVIMEDMGACTDSTVAACLNLVKSCHLFILIITYRQGWAPTAQEGGNGIDSITALELQHARDNNIPVLTLMADEDWLGNYGRKHNKRENR
ncbi:DUF4062 domain-containing protein [Teredinibacter purpureus]|uniref:DUF4062 domain-containing protein n=1 Tax=Teredinibacter purpureus TaxID=2731756 RepID=UPI0005F87685|nr:DUF4062 domain-containing protein [Teredinibacter purpureus]